MSTLQRLDDAGLMGELEALFAEHFKKNDDKAKKGLLQHIDRFGLQSAEVVKHIGDLQRKEILEPGIYKKFKDLNTELAGGGNGASDRVATPPKAKPEPKSTSKAEPKPSDSDEVDIGKGIFTDSDEEWLRDKLRAEEEKARKKLAAYERKLREQRIKKSKKKAQRLGLKAEEAAKIKELKEQIANVQATNKELKVNIKHNNEQIKAMRDEINKIRPKKSVTSGGESSTPVKKVDSKELESAKKLLTEYLAENSNAKSADIVEAIGFDRKLFNAAISSLKEEGKVKQHGRGPFTNYSLVG